MLPYANHKHLINVCKTRWVARIESFDVFTEVFTAIIRCFEIIKGNIDNTWNTDSVKKAIYLFHATVSFSFIAPLVFVSICLEVIRPPTVQLQDSALDQQEKRFLVCIYNWRKLEMKSTLDIPDGLMKRNLLRKV